MNDAKYQGLDLAEGEKVILDVQRSSLGRTVIWVQIGLAAAAMLLAGWFLTTLTPEDGLTNGILVGSCLVIAILIALSGIVFTQDFDQDWLVVTDRRVMQNTRHNLFARDTQEVRLDDIVEVRTSQSNIWQRLFNYGTVRLCTMGDEHDCIMTWIANPSEQLKPVREAIAGTRAGLQKVL